MPKLWADDEDEVLRQEWAKGTRTDDIGRLLGRSRNSVIGRAHRLGLEDHRLMPKRVEIDGDKIFDAWLEYWVEGTSINELAQRHCTSEVWWYKQFKDRDLRMRDQSSAAKVGRQRKRWEYLENG